MDMAQELKTKWYQNQLNIESDAHKVCDIVSLLIMTENDKNNIILIYTAPYQVVPEPTQYSVRCSQGRRYC